MALIVGTKQLHYASQKIRSDSRYLGIKCASQKTRQKNVIVPTDSR